MLEMDGVDSVLLMPQHDWGLSGKQRRDVCLWPWWGITVYWNGDVAPCCLYESDKALGNIHRQPVMDIWNGEQYQDLRRHMLSGEACRTCEISHITFNESFLRVHNPSIWAIPKAALQIAAAAFK